MNMITTYIEAIKQYDELLKDVSYISGSYKLSLDKPISRLDEFEFPNARFKISSLRITNTRSYFNI
jgi:hypothetical protein